MEKFAEGYKRVYIVEYFDTDTEESGNYFVDEDNDVHAFFISADEILNEIRRKNAADLSVNDIVSIIESATKYYA